VTGRRARSAGLHQECSWSFRPLADRDPDASAPGALDELLLPQPARAATSEARTRIGEAFKGIRAKGIRACEGSSYEDLRNLRLIAQWTSVPTTERGGAPMRQLELDRVSCAPARRSLS